MDITTVSGYRKDLQMYWNYNLEEDHLQFQVLNFVIHEIFGQKLGIPLQVSILSQVLKNLISQNISNFQFSEINGDYFPSCPVAGEYFGQLPDNPRFCAKLYSDCNKLDTMNYLLYKCNDTKEIIESKSQNTVLQI